MKAHNGKAADSIMARLPTASLQIEYSPGPNHSQRGCKVQTTKWYSSKQKYWGLAVSMAGS
jgi:hypothetical protein